MKLFRIYILRLLFLMCMVPSVRVYGQAVANFTASATSGCAPLVVSFTNTSQGATSYSWNLGNSNTSTLTNASTSYLTPGTYTVSLTATGSSGSNTKTIQIVVQQPPTVSFSAIDTLICKGSSVTFTNNTMLNAPGAGTYNWNFGDGNNSSAQTPTHQYTSQGYYTVTLTATNANGCAASQVINAYIHVLALPVVQFTANINNFCGLPAPIMFTDQSTSSSGLSHIWSFGDNTSSLTVNPTHSYATAGTFSVQEIITDIHGCSDSLTMNNYITIQHLVATMNIPDTACPDQAVTFINTTSGIGISTLWDYGDGNTSTTNTTVHTYNTAGLYTVKMIAFINGCSDTTSKQIFIRQLPVSSFSFSPAHPCPAPVNVQFTVTAPAGATYAWQFGDGTTSNVMNPLHSYYVDSFLPATLTVNLNGCIYITTDTVKVYDFIKAVAIVPRSGCPPLNAAFSLNALTTVCCQIAIPPPYPYAITSRSYDFGDGSPISNASTPLHTYTNPGYYHVTYTINTANGCSFTDTTSVAAGQKPIIDLFTANQHICRKDTIQFHAHAHGQQPILYYYAFGEQGAGDGGYVDDTAQQWIFGIPGTFHAFLIAYNWGCASDTSSRITIVVDSPGAAFTFHQPCDTPSKVDFNSKTLGATSLLWDFGDGDTSSAINPVHFYAAPGQYNVKLSAFNATSGCHDNNVQSVNILNFKPSILVADTAICKYDYLHFSRGYNSHNPPPVSQIWYLNGSSIDTSSQVIYQFNLPGIYTISLMEVDVNHCHDSTYRSILVSQPIAGFTALPTETCLPASILFSDSSFFMTGTYAISHTWDFGDGYSLTTANPTVYHSYSMAGTFSVKELITDNIGCVDSIIRYNYINTHKPAANFAVANPNHCAWDTITFVNTGTQNLQAAYWTFGDGTSSNAMTPVHAYTSSGTYTVTMAITDSLGCHDTLKRVAYISISKPHAAFSENNGSGVCVPLVVQFHNTSTNGATYAWSFGNSNSSVATNPSNSYNTPGNYNVQLIVSDAAGCKDTATGHVTLYGYSGAFSYNPLAGCPPVSVNFNANITGIPSITWDFADGTVTTPSANTTASHTYTNPGKYVPKIILLDSAGCHTSNYGTDTIKVDKIHAGFKVSTALCVYDTVRFTDTSAGLFTPATSWLWRLGDGGASITHNPTHNYHTPGSFTVTLIATDAAGCKDTVTHTIVIHPLPVITTIGDTTICLGDSARVTASGAISYLWAPAATIHCPACNPTFVAPILPTTYTVKGTDGFGCKNIDSVKIAFKYKTVSYPGAGGQICLGQSITLSDSGAQVYSWYPTTGLSDPHNAHPVANPTGSITYLAIAKTASCIPDTGIVQVFVNPLPMVTAIAGNNIVIAGGKVNLQASGPNIVSFLWNHADLLNCDTCSDPIATMQQTTIFTVTASNQFGCQDSTHVLVNVLCDKSQVFIPNTFTPNGDGQNDVFFPRGIGIKIVKSFRIYNRWGELVFERDDFNINDESKGWDGTYKGGKPIPDTYVYALDATCEEGQPISWKGDVTLLK